MGIDDLMLAPRAGIDHEPVGTLVAVEGMAIDKDVCFASLGVRPESLEERERLAQMVDEMQQPQWSFAATMVSMLMMRQ